VQRFTALWWGGWLVWHAAAISLMAFYLVLALRWGRLAPIRCGLAIVCGAAGLAADLSAQALWMGLVSRIEPRDLPLLESAAGVLSGYLGNGLYTASGLLLTWAGSAEL